MGKCALCSKKEGRGHGSFFKVPPDQGRRLKWAESCGIALQPHSVICEDHFLDADLIRGPKKCNILYKAVPCQNLGPKNLLESMNDTGFSSFLESDVLMQDVSELPDIIVECRDCETQTEPTAIQCSADAEIFALRAELRSVMEEKNRVTAKLAEANAIINNMRSFFTEGQYRKMMFPERPVKWQWGDISSAICLHAAGPRAYNHLYKKGYPLPHVRTLHRWSRLIDMSEGILTAAIDLMRQAHSQLANDERICIVSFDEMKVTESYEYDQVADRVRKPTNYVQVAMARGVKKSWKLPVFYSFDCQMTKEILENIIAILKGAGFPVVAIVCDMGPTNQKLFKSLGVSWEKPWFSSPSAEEKVFVFADAPHLLKLIRNHFLDTGYMCNGKTLTSRTLCELLKHTSGSDASIAFQLTNEHLAVKGIGRQKVSLAAQVFSNTTANAIRRCYSLGMELYQPIETADMLQLVNDWFDVLNSTMSTYNYPGKEPYGLKPHEQSNVILRMNKFMSVPIIPGKQRLQVFQKGVLMTNAALVMLQQYLENKYNMKYIVTSRLNQDVLEHFFGAIRSKGGLNDHPTPKEFTYRLRKYILARNTEHLQGTGNVGNNTTEWLCSSNNVDVRNYSSAVCENGDTLHIPEDPEEEPEAEFLTEPHAAALNDFGVLHEDALEYISGYVIHKLNLEECEGNERLYTWVDQVSKGSLKKPAPHFVNGIKALETIFYKVNGLRISHAQNIHQRLIVKSMEVDLPENVKRFFFKCRIYFRLRDMNKRLKVRKAKQRVMGYKKMLKINL